MLTAKLVAATVALVAMAAISGCAGPTAIATDPPAVRSQPDVSPARIRLGSITGVALPTLIVAQDEGFLAKEALTVETSYLSSGGSVSDALAAGQLDLGATNVIISVLAAVKGAKTMMVSGLEYSLVDKTGKSWEAVYVVVRDGEGIRNLSDLKGKKVAVSDLGGAYNYLLRATMLANGIDPDKAMTIVTVPFPQMPGALMQKLVDAVIVTADGFSRAEKLGKVAVIGTHTTLARLDTDISSPVAANTDFLQRSPDVVVRFLRALIQARRWMADDVANNGGENIKDLTAKAMQYSPELAQAFYDTRGGYYGKELDAVNLLDVPARVAKRHFEALKVNGLIAQDAEAVYERIVDIRPLKRAYETLGLPWDESKH